MARIDQLEASYDQLEYLYISKGAETETMGVTISQYSRILRFSGKNSL